MAYWTKDNPPPVSAGKFEWNGKQWLPLKQQWLPLRDLPAAVDVADVDVNGPEDEEPGSLWTPSLVPYTPE